MIFKFFRRGRRVARVPRPVIIKIRRYIETRLRRLADYLQQKLEVLSPLALSMYLMGFCISGSSICAYLLMTAIYPNWTSPVTAGPVNTRPNVIMMDTVFVYPSTGSLKNQK